jgi:hypothetical protein
MVRQFGRVFVHFHFLVCFGCFGLLSVVVLILYAESLAADRFVTVGRAFICCISLPFLHFWCLAFEIYLPIQKKSFVQRTL